MPPGVLVELHTVPSDVYEEWRGRHDASLERRAALPGVRAARRGREVSAETRAPVEIAVYDLDDVAAADWADPAWEERGVTSERTVYGAIGAVDPDYRPPQAELLHGAFFEADPPHHDELNDWYDLEHIPAIVQVPGYLSARRFRAVDDPDRFLALYDVADLATALGPVAAQAMDSPWSDRIRAKVVRKRARRLFLLA